MRWSGIHINAGAMALGRREDTAAAVADGRYDPDFHEAHGYRSLCVADGALAADLAVEAARTALRRCGVDPADIALVVYASSTPEGREGMVPAAYLQGKVAGTTVSALEVGQTCNSALAALELSAAYAAVVPDGAVLLATSDKHQLSSSERYRADPGNLDADGATALVLSRRDGVARLLSTVVLSDGRYNDIALLDASSFPDRPAFLAEYRRRLKPMTESMSGLRRESIARALDEAGVDSAGVNRWVFANVGRMMIDWGLLEEFDIKESQTTWDWGRTVGHTGTGDQFAGLTHLLETGQVHAGDRIALCGNGVGFSYGCAVIEVGAEPAWETLGDDA
jgi:3-oxoacyl-[acyl-carrier-protein] synthase III